MLWLLTLLSLTGVVLNIKKNKLCFVCWIASNLCWMIIDLKKGIPEQAALFFVYFCLSVYGLIEWTKKPLTNP